MSHNKILLIEDEPAIAGAVIFALRTEGFAADGLAVLRADAPAPVIRAIGLPDGNGLDLVRTGKGSQAVPRDLQRAPASLSSIMLNDPIYVAGDRFLLRCRPVTFYFSRRRAEA